VAPMAILIFMYILMRGIRDDAICSDMSVMEVYLTHMLNGRIVLVGPYSKMGTHHLGPWLFYFLTPFYWVCNRSSSSMFLAAGFLNLGGLIGVACLASKLYEGGDGFLAYTSLFLTATLVYCLGPPILLSPWNPWIIIIPFMGFLYVASMAPTQPKLLPILVGVGSFVMQTHYSIAFTAIAVMATSLLLCLVRHRGPQRIWRQLLVAAAVLIVAWAPVLIDQVFVSGNLGKLCEVWSIHQGNHSLDETLREASQRLAMLPIRAGGTFLSRDEEVILAAIIFVATLASTACAVKRGSNVTAHLGIVVLVGWVVSPLSISRVPGYIAPWYTLWMIPLGTCALAVLAAVSGEWTVKRVQVLSIVRRMTTIRAGDTTPKNRDGGSLEWEMASPPDFAGRRVASNSTGRLRMLCKGVAIGIFTILALWPFQVDPSGFPPVAAAKDVRMVEELIQYLDSHPTRRVLLDFSFPREGFRGIMLAAALYKRNVPFALACWNWPLLLPSSYRPNGREDLIVSVGGSELTFSQTLPHRLPPRF
jgi:hypothetical protein